MIRRNAEVEQLIRQTKSGERPWRVVSSGRGLYLEKERNVFRSVGAPVIEVTETLGWKSAVDQVVSRPKHGYTLRVDGTRVDAPRRQIRSLLRAISQRPEPTAEQRELIEAEGFLFQDSRSLYDALMRHQPATMEELREAAKLPEKRCAFALDSLERKGHVTVRDGKAAFTATGLDAAWLMGNRMYDGIAG